MISKKDRLFRQRFCYFIAGLATLHPLLLHYLTSYSLREPTPEGSLILSMGLATLFGTLFIGIRLVLEPNHIRVGPKLKFRDAPKTLFKSISAVFSCTALGYMLLDLLPGPPPPLEYLASGVLTVFNKGYGGPVFFSLVYLVSLVFSELVFRGFWLNTLSRRLNFEVALPASALLYALAHIAEPAGAIALMFFAGLGYGLVYRLYGLSAALVVHLLVDSTVILQSVFTDAARSEFLGQSLIFFLVFFFAGVCLFLRDLLGKRLAPDKLEGSAYEKMYGAI